MSEIEQKIAQLIVEDNIAAGGDAPEQFLTIMLAFYGSVVVLSRLLQYIDIATTKDPRFIELSEGAPLQFDLRLLERELISQMAEHLYLKSSVV